MDKLNILVTGGAGYIGSHIVKDLCNAGHNVTVLDNFSLGSEDNIHPSAKVVRGDIRNEGDLNKAFAGGKDAVFHFAAWKAAGESMEVPEKYAENNIAGTLRLLAKTAEYRTKNFIFSSSAAVYGNPQYLPIDEKHPKIPENYYGYTKLAIEENLEWFSKLKGINYAALRYFNATGYDIDGKISGKEKNPANLSPVVMEAAAGVRKKLMVFGDDYPTPDGTCIRDYIHVNDLAEAHLKAMEYLIRENDNLVVNLGTGKGYSVLEIIKTAEKVTEKKINFEVTGRRKGDPSELFADSGLAFEKLAWRPKYSDPETIFRTMKKVYMD